VLQSNLAEFWGWQIFMQIRQRIFKFNMQICHLFFTAFWNFWHITCLSTYNHRWVINTQTGLVFWPTLYKTPNNVNVSIYLWLLTVHTVVPKQEAGSQNFNLPDKIQLVFWWISTHNLHSNRQCYWISKLVANSKILYKEIANQHSYESQQLLDKNLHPSAEKCKKYQQKLEHKQTHCTMQ